MKRLLNQSLLAGRRNRSSERGVGLMDVVFSLAILSMTTVAVMETASLALRAGTRLQRITGARAVASGAVETLLSYPFDHHIFDTGSDTPGGDEMPFSDEEMDGRLFSCSLHAVPQSRGVKRVRLHVADHDEPGWPGVDVVFLVVSE